MSIVTKRGDSGQTDLIGKVRVSKSDARVDCYGTVDELVSQLGFARSICEDSEVSDLIQNIQRELFKLGSAIATAPGGKVAPPQITTEMIRGLDAHVERIEAMDGILGDWSLPGALPVTAALDVARTVCRRAERAAVRIAEHDPSFEPSILTYLNRLSDLIWLFGRVLEIRAGVNGSLRPEGKRGKPWSRPW